VVAVSGEPLLRPSALARFWTLHPKTVNDWIRSGRLVGIKSPGAHYRIRPSDVRDFCAREAMPVPPFARSDVTHIVLAGVAAAAQRGVERALAEKSVTIEAFGSALEGVVTAARLPPAIFVLDAATDRLDAEEAIRTLRAVAGFREVVVVAFNAPSQGRADAYVRAGATLALVKPTKKGASPTLGKALAELIA
jgi:CheY-like chemotaxis protein